MERANEAALLDDALKAWRGCLLRREVFPPGRAYAMTMRQHDRYILGLPGSMDRELRCYRAAGRQSTRAWKQFFDNGGVIE